jgi:hypothetical protein
VARVASSTGAPLHEVASRAEQAWRMAQGTPSPGPIIGDDRAPA